MNDYEKIKNAHQYTIDASTGEVVEEVIFRVEAVFDSGFSKVWMENCCKAMTAAGKSAPLVILFLLQNLDKKSNCYSGTESDISIGTKLSRQTVCKTIRALKKVNFLATRRGKMMINPDVITTRNREGRMKQCEDYLKFKEASWFMGCTKR